MKLKKNWGFKMKILFSNIAKKQLKKLNSRFQQKVLFTLEKFEKNLTD